MASFPPHIAYGAHIASDLEWVIFSPSLLKAETNPNLARLAQNRKIVEDVQRNPENLLNFIKTMKRQNLGSYFEHLVFYWLECLDDVQVISTNKQVFFGKETLGEIDLVFEYKNQVYHWELSVKFYANIGSGLAEDKWVGPLKKDNLERKLNRLFDHQLPLIKHLNIQEALSSRVSDEIKSTPFVKGILFAKACDKDSPVLPLRISPKCLLRTWCCFSDLHRHLPSQITHYSLLSKPQWMNGTNKNDDEKAGSVADLSSELGKYFSEKFSPVLVSYHESEGTNSETKEKSLIFVMPHGWLAFP